MSENGRGAAWHVWRNAARHGMGTAWARHGMWELALNRNPNALFERNGIRLLGHRTFHTVTFHVLCLSDYNKYSPIEYFSYHVINTSQTSRCVLQKPFHIYSCDTRKPHSYKTKSHPTTRITSVQRRNKPSRHWGEENVQLSSFFNLGARSG
jgi:hypothetical protein